MYILCLVMRVLCLYAFKLLSGFFGQGLALLGEDRLATLRYISASCCAARTILSKTLSVWHYSILQVARECRKLITAVI